MQAGDPQLMYMVLVLPSLFGLTLVGEGVYKLTQEKFAGWVNVSMGILFIGVVISGYFFFFTAH